MHTYNYYFGRQKLVPSKTALERQLLLEIHLSLNDIYFIVPTSLDHCFLSFIAIIEGRQVLLARKALDSKILGICK